MIDLETARVRLRYHSAVAAAVRRMGYRAFSGYRMKPIERRVRAPAEHEIVILSRDPRQGEVLIEWTDARSVVHKAIIPEIALTRHARKAGMRTAR